MSQLSLKNNDWFIKNYFYWQIPRTLGKLNFTDQLQGI